MADDDLTVPIRALTTQRPVRSTTTVTARAVLAGILIALISVLVTAVIAVPLAARAAERSARAALSTQADAVAVVLGERLDRRPRTTEQRLAAELGDLGLNAYLIHDGTATDPGLPDWVIRDLAAGRPVTGRYAMVAGRLSMVEGRPLGDDDGVALVRRAGTGLARQVLRNLWFPLLAGLGAGALAGVLLGRRMARPIRNAATAAARLSSGDRAVRLRPEPPEEVERLSLAINELAEALTGSERRQRDFLLSISHELRTPLTTIRGYAEALADGVVRNESAQDAGRIMLGEAERLDRLVADLLALARLEADDFAIEPAEVRLGELLHSMEQAFGPRCARHGLQLRVLLPEPELIVWTDPVRLRQIVDGLTENALRVAPPGSPIALAAGVSAPGQVFVQVRDGGPGLSDDDLAVAFERGALYRRYQGTRKVGSGLGLALAAGLARRLGGKIVAGHAPEGGAQFTVYLPRTLG